MNLYMYACVCFIHFLELIGTQSESTRNYKLRYES